MFLGDNPNSASRRALNLTPGIEKASFAKLAFHLVAGVGFEPTTFGL